MSSQATRFQASGLCAADPPSARSHGKLPVLIVLHQERSSPGRVGNALRALGFSLDIRRPRFGDPLPTTLSGHSGAMIFGGPMSANDDEDYIRREIDWIAVPLKEGRPFLGICLGAQMLARQLGARITPHAEGRVEVGYYPIWPTQAGRRVVPHWPGEVYHWHGEGFDLPRGCELLARGDQFPNQAFRSGSCFGVQFHPDVTMAMMHRWTTLAADRMAGPGARARSEHFAARAVNDVAERAWLDGFLQQWFASDRAASLAEDMLLEAAE